MTPNDFLDLGEMQLIKLYLGSPLRTRYADWLVAFMSIHVSTRNWGYCLQTFRKSRKHWLVKIGRVCTSGAYATNSLGLSEQVLAQAIFLTDGPSRTVKIGRQEIQLRHTTPRYMAAADRLSGLLMQGFRHLGREHITPQRMAHLKPDLERKINRSGWATLSF